MSLDSRTGARVQRYDGCEQCAMLVEVEYISRRKSSIPFPFPLTLLCRQKSYLHLVMAIARADLAVPLLVQAPPGQLTNVHDDLLGLLSSDGYDANADVAQFKAKADAARKEHNLEQLIVVELPRGKGKSVLSRSSVHVGEADRFLSPREKLSFKVDHTTLKTSDPRPYKENKHVEPLRSSLEKLVTEYIDDRYATGVTEVIAVPLPRTAVQVEDKMMEEAKTASAEDLEPADVTSAIGTGASEVAVADGQAESNEVKTDEDEVIDDPIQAVKDVESVEQEAEMKDSVASEEGEEKKTVDEDDQQQKSTTEDKAQAPAPLQEEDDEETQGETKLVIHIVANRYKLSNFW